MEEKSSQSWFQLCVFFVSTVGAAHKNTPWRHCSSAISVPIVSNGIGRRYHADVFDGKFDPRKTVKRMDFGKNILPILKATFELYSIVVFFICE